MCCVIVEGDSLALSTALKNSPGTLYPVYVTAYKICHFLRWFKKGTKSAFKNLRKAPTKNLNFKAARKIMHY